jgi:hypothetical protein
MKTIVACFLGLIALVTFAGGSPLYADALEAESLALSVAPGAGANGVGSPDDGHCVFYSDGADNCIVNMQPEINMQRAAVDQSSTAVSEPDPSATEPALTIRFMNAIPVAVVQTVTIAASGADAEDREGTSSAQPSPGPATEPVSDYDAQITTGAIVEPTGQSADAIGVAIVQSAMVVVPGQGASGEPPPAELQPPPLPPTSVLEAKNDGHDNLQ